MRALRRARGVTLADLGDRLGRSVGWLSQVERDISAPSIDDLRHIAAALDAPISLLFAHDAAPAAEAGHIVRRDTRRQIGSTAALVEELLSPDLTDDFEMLHSTFQPHSRIGEVVTRPTQEVGYILSGKLDLTISGQPFTVHPGDSFRIRAEPFEWINPYDEPAVAIWVIAPPIY